MAKPASLYILVRGFHMNLPFQLGFAYLVARRTREIRVSRFRVQHCLIHRGELASTTRMPFVRTGTIKRVFVGVLDVRSKRSIRIKAHPTLCQSFCASNTCREALAIVFGRNIRHIAQ